MLGDIIKGVTMVTGSEVVGVEITGTVDDSLLVTATGESLLVSPELGIGVPIIRLLCLVKLGPLTVCNSIGVLASMQYNDAVVVGTCLLGEFTNTCDVGWGVEVLSVFGKVLLGSCRLPWPLLQILA